MERWMTKSVGRYVLEKYVLQICLLLLLFVVFFFKQKTAYEIGQ